MITRMLKISSIEEEKVAKNGRPYRVVRFQPFNVLGNGTQVFSNAAISTRTIWSGYTDKDGNIFKADGLWSSIEQKEAVVGSIVGGYVARVAAFPYQIDGTTNANFFTAVIFDNEDEIAYCNKQLAQYYSCVLVDGVLTAPKQLDRPVSASIVLAEQP